MVGRGDCMKNPLNKRVFRDIKENAGKYIGIFLILASIIFVGSAFMVTLSSADSSLKKQEETKMVEDGSFELFGKLPKEALDAFSKKDILLEENNYVIDNEFMGDTKVVVYDKRNLIDLYDFFEGEDVTGENDVILDRLFATNHKIEVGDTIKLNGEEFKVSGLVAFSDYTSLFKSNQDLVMDVMTFGVAMVSHDGFARFDEGQWIHRYTYRFNNRELTDQEKEDLLKDIQEILLKNGCMLQSFLTAEHNQSINFLKDDMGKDGPMMEVFIYILLAIIAFVFAVLTGNTIEKESVVIGTLRALGYTRWEMIWHYLRPTLMVTLVAAVIGNVLGYTVMLQPFLNVYYSSYCLPPIDIEFSVRAFSITTIAPLLIMVVINVALLYNKLVLNPLKFLRKDLKKGKQKKVVKLPDFSFMNRFRIRVILQNKICYLILFVGIYLSGLLLMFGVGLAPLLDHYVDSIEETLPYEYQYLLKAPVDNEGGEKVKMYSVSTYSDKYQKDIEITLMGVEKESRFFEFDASSKKDKAVISEPMAKKLRLKEGDKVTLKDGYQNKEYTLTVEAICDYNSTLAVFMEKEILNELLDADKEDFNCLLSNEKLDIEDSYVAKYLTRSDILGATSQLMDMFDTILKVFCIASVVIYMILMYILTKTVIEKNAIYISLMKVFGYNSKEAGKLYLNATTYTVIFSVLICLPLQYLGFSAMMDYITGMIEGYVPFYMPTWVYIFITIVGIGAYFIINFFHVRKVRRIPMIDALKSRE